MVTNLFGTNQRLAWVAGRWTLSAAWSTWWNTPCRPPRWPGGGRSLSTEGKHRSSQTGPHGARAPTVFSNRRGSVPAHAHFLPDGGAFVTLPLVYTEHPDGSGHNLGMYRVQRFDDTTTGIHWQIHKGGGYHYWAAEQTNQPLPLTLYIGGPPALMLAAIAPLPENIPELLLASLLMGSKLALADDPRGGHRLVAEAEFAVKGVVPPHLRRPEGPFGDHYGYNSLQHDYPVFQTTHLYHRKDAIYPATVVGRPRQEDYFIGDFLQDLLSPLFPLVMKGVCQLKTFGETGFHCLAAARSPIATRARSLPPACASWAKANRHSPSSPITDGSIDVAHFPARRGSTSSSASSGTGICSCSPMRPGYPDYGPVPRSTGPGRRCRPGPGQASGPAGNLHRFTAGGMRGRWPTCRVPWWSGRPTDRRRICRAALLNHPGVATWPVVLLVDSLPRPPPPCRSSPTFFTRFERPQTSVAGKPAPPARLETAHCPTAG